jgi:hypothetical protein
MMFTLWPGNVPSNVGRDAKYSVKSGGRDGMVVKLLYRMERREEALLSTAEHDDLVDMVNKVKVAKSGQPGGAFYINEYLDVLVPTPDGCYLAGRYGRPLEFEFEGRVIGPVASSDLEPGEDWTGPHVGIAYTLTAGAADIRYVRNPRPKVQQTVLLSDEVGRETARALASRLGQYKGKEGGRIYINESCELFAPVATGGDYRYLYLGRLEEGDPWFARPDVPGS